MASLNVENFERKLAGLQNTMDSIQTLSLWIVHHKSSHQQIVQVWMKHLRKSKPPEKLNLMYLCNDVLQNGRRKGATAYNESFKTVLVEAASLTRDSTIRKSVDRIFNIWEERSVYDSDFITQLKGALVSSKVRPKKVNTKVLAEFKPQKLIDSISSFKRLEDDMIFRQQQFSQLRVDVTSSETLKQLKDRQGGKKFSEEFDEATEKLEEFVKSMDKQLAERKKMVELVEQAEIFYSTQHSEAKIVANAYKNFGTRISNFKKRIDQYKKDLPDPDSPIPSPSEDAPSPGSTPPPEEPDTREVEDMDISDDDEEGKAASNIVAVTPSKSITRTGTGIRPSHSHTGPASKRAKLVQNEKPTTASAIAATAAGSNILELLQNVGVTDPSTLKKMNAAQLVSLLSKTEPKSTAEGEESPDVKKVHSAKTETVDAEELTPAGVSTSFLSQASQKEKPAAGSGESSLDSRLREMMSNAPSLPQAVSGLFDSPVRKSHQESPKAAAGKPSKSATEGNTKSSPSKSTVWPQKPVQHVPATVPPVPPQPDVGGDKTPEGGVTPEGGMTPPDDIGTPLHDEEGGATPVQDEEPVANAPDLLSRLINQTSEGGRTRQSDLLSKLAGLVKLGKGGQAETQTVMSAGQGGTPQGAPISSVLPPQNPMPGLQQYHQPAKGMKVKPSSTPRGILKNANGPGVSLPMASPPGVPSRSILKNKSVPAVGRGTPVGAPPRGIAQLGGGVDNSSRLQSPQGSIPGNATEFQGVGRGGGMMPQRLPIGDSQFNASGPPVTNAPLQGPRIPTVTDGKPDFRGQQAQGTPRGQFGQANHMNEGGFGQGQPIQRIGDAGVVQGQPIQRLGEQNDLGAGRGQPIQRLGGSAMAGQPIQRLGGRGSGAFRGQNPERRQSIDVVQRDRPQQFDRDRNIDPGTLTAVNSGSQPSVPQGSPIARLEPRSEPGPSFGPRDPFYSPRPRQQASPRLHGPRPGHRPPGPRHHGPRPHGPRQFGFGPRSPPPRKPPPPPPYPPPPGAYRQRQPFQARPRY
ncbi:regulation of nuclear pre-mRNA domain-containing protein 2-like isoform X2 [Branchiostoma lanceolatum]|uniref:regulation of nuclear pre-mRNA domain-containing protein 2-like isoform X2 n=1 Tax=Branchiostoma lanceolatum TaxID=7740 RepID=UPI0034525720